MIKIDGRGTVFVMHVSAKVKSPPLLLHFMYFSWDKVYYKHEVRFLLYLLGQIVTWNT